MLDGGKIDVCLLKQEQDQNVSLLHFNSIPKLLASAIRERERQKCRRLKQLTKESPKMYVLF